MRYIQEQVCRLQHLQYIAGVSKRSECPLVDGLYVSLFVWYAALLRSVSYTYKHMCSHRYCTLSDLYTPVCIHMYACLQVRVQSCIQMCVCIYIYVSVDIYICLLVYVCTHVCMCCIYIYVLHSSHSSSLPSSPLITDSLSHSLVRSLALSHNGSHAHSLARSLTDSLSLSYSLSSCLACRRRRICRSRGKCKP